jgi:hypothetical protein
MINKEKTLLAYISDEINLQLKSLWANLPRLILDFDLKSPINCGPSKENASKELVDSSHDEVTDQILTLTLSLENPALYSNQKACNEDIFALIERVERVYRSAETMKFGGANLQILNANPHEFCVTNGSIALSGDLTKGIVRHRLMCDRSVNFEYSGNFTVFCQHGTERTNDTEEAVTTWGLTKSAEKIIVWHKSDLQIEHLFKRTELYSVKYEYSISQASDEVELVASVSGIPRNKVTDFRLTTAVDQMSREISFSGVETAWKNTKEFHTAREARVRQLSVGAIDRLVIVPEEIGVPRETLIIEPLNQESIDQVRSESESSGRFHWIYLVYDLSDLHPGDDWAIRERRVINRAYPATAKTRHIDDELQYRKKLVSFRAVLAALGYLESIANSDSPVSRESFSSLYPRLELDVHSACSREIDPIDTLSVVSDIFMLTEAGLFISQVLSDRVGNSRLALLKLIHSRVIRLIDILDMPAKRKDGCSVYYFESVLNAILFLARSSASSSEHEDSTRSLGICIGLITHEPPINREMPGFHYRKWKTLNSKVTNAANVPVRGVFLFIKAIKAADQLDGFAERNRVEIPYTSSGQIKSLKGSALDAVYNFRLGSSVGDCTFGVQFNIDPILMFDFLRYLHSNEVYQLKNLDLSPSVGIAVPESIRCEEPANGHEDVANDSPASLQRRFSKVYEQNLWGDSESRSGPGSRRDSAQAVHSISVLKRLCSEYRISSISDIPCGDFNWFHDFLYPNPGISYTGYDIVPDLIMRNRRIFRYNFELLDVSSQIPPPADLVFCKDLFNHLIYRSIANSLLNMISSNSKFLLVSNNFNYIENVDLVDDVDTQTEHGSRHFDLTLAPFHFPNPIWNDHYLGFWLLSDLPLGTLKRIAGKS